MGSFANFSYSRVVDPKTFRVTIGNPTLSCGLLRSKLTSARNSFCGQILSTVEILCRSISTLVAVEDSRSSIFIENMESFSASTIPRSEPIDGEVLLLVAIDPASVAVEDTWDLDSAFNASAHESGAGSGVFKKTIPTNIDPKGEYTIRTDFRHAQSSPTATPTTPVDVPEPVTFLIVQGDMKFYHNRSPEDPPAHLLEGEDDDEAEGDEDQAGGSAPAPPPKRALMVTARNLATLGKADEGFTSADFLPAQSPPPTPPPTPMDVPEPVTFLIVQGDMKFHHERSPEEPPAHLLEGEDDDEAESVEDQAGGSAPAPPPKRARMVTAGNFATLGLADKRFTFDSVLEPHVPAGPTKK